MLPPACSGSYPFQSDVGTMGLFMGATIITVVLRALIYCRGSSRALQLATRFSLTGALVLLTPAAARTTALLYCVPTTLSATAVGVLDGGGAVASSIGPSGTATVLLLKSNPYFVCWAPGGQHTGAASVAVATAVLLAFVGPLALFLWVRQDRWLREQLQHESIRDSWAARAILSGWCTWCRCRICREESDRPLTLSEENEKLEKPDKPAPSLAPMLNDYRPWAWYTKFLDIYFAVLVAALQSTLPRPKTFADITAKAAVIMIGG